MLRGMCARGLRIGNLTATTQEGNKVRNFYILCRRELRLVGPTDRKVALDDWIILVEAYMQIQAAADE